MASLELHDVRKAYGDTPVLDDVSLTMEAREFVAFLGPSGQRQIDPAADHRRASRRSTAARCVLEGRRIDQLPPGERGVAMVFQHYALYPHMTRAREHGVRPPERARAEGRDRARGSPTRRGCSRSRRSSTRSPGRCRAASASGSRSAARSSSSPKLFLLDEPLSNLDAALRMRTRVELAQLRQRVDAAVIMVTHDQAEAMTLADRIVVMNDRRIQQVGAPMEIYARPANAFVARFVGSPAMTLAPAELVPGDGALRPRPARRRRRGRDAGAARRASGGRRCSSGFGPRMCAVTAPGARQRPTPRSSWSSGSASAPSSTPGSPTGCDHRRRTKATAASGSATRSACGIDGAAAHLFGPDGAGHHAEPAA